MDHALIRSCAFRVLLAGAISACVGCRSAQNSDRAPESSATGVGSSGGAAAAGPDASEEANTITGGFTIRHADWKGIGYRWDWTGFPGMGRNERVESMDVYPDILVVQGTATTMTVIDAVSGRNDWSVQLANPLNRFVGTVRDGDKLYAAAESEVFIIDARTGNWLDRQRLEIVVNTRPVQYGQTLIFGTANGRLLSHRLEYGLSAWQYDVGSPIEADPVLLDNGVVGAMAHNGQGIFVQASNARALGRPKTGGALATDPVTDGKRMYVAGLDQSAYAFVPGSDRHVWRYRTDEKLTVQPTVHDGVFYLTVPGTGLVALDADTGSERWIGPDAGGEVIASRDGSLIVWDNGTIKAVDPANGDVISSFAAEGLRMLKADTFSDGSLFGVTRANAVIRFSPR